MLADVNVLVAIAWPNHVHHDAAQNWFYEEAQNGWATCPVTESGFIRISSNRSVMSEAVLPGEAVELLRRLRKVGRHRFLTDDVSLASAAELPIERLAGYRQVTDAHLLCLAQRRKARLVTFDSAIASLLPDQVARDTLLVLGRVH